MNETTITIIAGLVAVLAICIIYRHVSLTIQIRDIVNVSLQANKEQESQKRRIRSIRSFPGKINSRKKMAISFCSQLYQMIRRK